jgi:predicted lactoylglutathione lyase
MAVAPRVSLVTLGVRDVAVSEAFYRALGWEVAIAAGGTILKPASSLDWGMYHGHVADPDGHVWEIAFNPDWPIGPDGRPVVS